MLFVFYAFNGDLHSDGVAVHRVQGRGRHSMDKAQTRGPAAAEGFPLSTKQVPFVP